MLETSLEILTHGPAGADTALALAAEYEAGLKKMEASGYEEFADAIPNHKLIIKALRAFASARPPAERPVAQGVRNALIARADKYLHTGSGEYASEIMRDMAEFIRKLPSVRPSEAAVACEHETDLTDILAQFTPGELYNLVFGAAAISSDDAHSIVRALLRSTRRKTNQCSL